MVVGGVLFLMREYWWWSEVRNSRCGSNGDGRWCVISHAGVMVVIGGVLFLMREY